AEGRERAGTARPARYTGRQGLRRRPRPALDWAMTGSLSLAPDERRVGFLVGAAVGAALAARTAGATDAPAVRAALADGVVPLAPPAGRRRAAVALADGL